MVLLSAATVSDKMHSSVRHLRIAGKVGCTIVVVGISRKRMFEDLFTPVLL